MDNPYYIEYCKYLEPNATAWDAMMYTGFDRAFEAMKARDTLVQKYAWAVPSPSAIELIARHTSSIIEICAGTGYWAYVISQTDVDIIAYDEKPYKNKWCDGEWYKVHKGGPECVKGHQDRTLMLCWPPYNMPMSYEALEVYKGNMLIYIGEIHGCTADERFREVLDTNWLEITSCHIPQWHGIHDRLYIYKRYK